MEKHTKIVMPVLVTGIHAASRSIRFAWMPAMNAGMTMIVVSVTALLSLPAFADAPKPVDACTLLTVDEIASVTGQKVGQAIAREGAAAEGSAPSVCIWRVASDSDRATVDAPLQGSNYVMLNAVSWVPGNPGPTKFVQEFRDAAKQNLIDQTPVPVQVGDEALYWGDGVAVRKGTYSFGISVHLQGGKPTEQAM